MPDSPGLATGTDTRITRLKAEWRCTPWTDWVGGVLEVSLLRPTRPTTPPIQAMTIWGRQRYRFRLKSFEIVRLCGKAGATAMWPQDTYVFVFREESANCCFCHCCLDEWILFFVLLLMADEDWFTFPWFLDCQKTAQSRSSPSSGQFSQTISDSRETKGR